MTYWRDTTVRKSFEQLEGFLEKYDKEFETVLEDIKTIKKEKIGIIEYKKQIDELTKSLKEFDLGNEKQGDDIKTLEHYVERYMPIQV